MQSTALVSIEEYLSTSCRPDSEYIDGEVRERNAGEIDHCRLPAGVIGPEPGGEDSLVSLILDKIGSSSAFKVWRTSA